MNQTPHIEIVPGVIAPVELTGEVEDILEELQLDFISGYNAFTSSDDIVLDGEYSSAEIKALWRIAQLMDGY